MPVDRRVLALALVGLLLPSGARSEPREKAPAPAEEADPPLTLHVVAAKAYVYRAPRRTKTPWRALPVATPLVVAPEPVEGEALDFWHILEGEGAGGFVSREDLGFEAPTALSLLEQAQNYLRGGSLNEAVRWAEGALALDASSREAWDLLAAIHDARGNVLQARAVHARRSRLAALPAPAEDEPRQPVPVVGEPRSIAAAALPARALPSRTAEILSELSFNTRVEVLAVQGEFTKVSWRAEAGEIWIVRLGRGEDYKSRDATHEVGWVDTAFLAPAPTSREELLARAAEAEKQDRFVAEARDRERAALFPPVSNNQLLQLTDAAVHARRYPLAATTSLRWTAVGLASAEEERGRVSLTLYFGCQRAPPVRPSTDCLPAMDTAGDASGALRAKYPSGPWVHVSISGSRELQHRDKQVFVYSLPFKISHQCEIFTGRARFKAMRFPQQPYPWPGEGETLDIWVTGGGYEDVLYGVVAAEDEADARERVEGEPDSYLLYPVHSPTDLVQSLPIVAGPWRDRAGCAR